MLCDVLQDKFQAASCVVPCVLVIGTEKDTFAGKFYCCISCLILLQQIIPIIRSVVMGRLPKPEFPDLQPACTSLVTRLQGECFRYTSHNAEGKTVNLACLSRRLMSR